MMSNRKYITTLCAVTVLFLFADQNLMAPNLSLIAKDFDFDAQQRGINIYEYIPLNVDDTISSVHFHVYELLFPLDDKLGADIAVGFFLIGGPIALIAGYYADMVNRCVLFGITVMLGSFASGKCIDRNVPVRIMF